MSANQMRFIPRRPESGGGGFAAPDQRVPYEAENARRRVNRKGPIQAEGLPPSELYRALDKRSEFFVVPGWLGETNLAAAVPPVEGGIVAVGLASDVFRRLSLVKGLRLVMSREPMIAPDGTVLEYSPKDFERNFRISPEEAQYLLGTRKREYPGRRRRVLQSQNQGGSYGGGCKG